MESVLNNVPSTALWATALASIIVAVFMAVQAFTDPARRWQFILFSFTWSVNFVIQVSHPLLVKPTFELLRVLWMAICTGSLFWLLGYKSRQSFLVAFLLSIGGLALWKFWYFDRATTIIFPISYVLMAYVHWRQYWKNRGFSSLILCASAGAMGMLCSTYYLAMKTGDDRIIALGYGHFALLALFSVILGWIHLPRELRGFLPVRVKKSQAVLFLIIVFVAEIGVIAGQLWFFSFPPVLYLVASAIVFFTMIGLYFYHRHQLVIYTANVTQLLEERTASLRQAQEELAKQNEIQAHRLIAQAKEIETKAQVIERQRRLELAAQTAGGAAHDIQNIISPLQSFIQRLFLEANDAARVKALADKMLKQVNHLLDLNSHMLALSRRGRLDFHPVNLNDLIRDQVDRFGLDNRIVVEGESTLWVNGSWSQLSRALCNLITNAIEAAPKRQENVVVRYVAKELRNNMRCHLGFLPPGKYACIEVEDYGPGIPDERIEQIFEPFFSSKNGEQRSGSGLGLSIVNAVLDDHNGVIDLHTDSTGTKFTLYLPAIEPPKLGHSIEDFYGNETIMLIDSDASTRKHCEDILTEAHYSVICATNFAEVISILQLEHVDLLLLDLKADSKTAMETYYAAIHLRPGIKAILYSHFVFNEDARQLQELGVSTLLQKPASRIEILQKVRELLEEKIAEHAR